MALKEIFLSRPELAEYDYSKFSSRLSSIQKTVKEHTNRRAAMEQAAFDNFVAVHPPAMYSHKGYIQWQGSKAKEQLKKDIHSMARLKSQGTVEEGRAEWIARING
jgi:hypothetical protein